MTEKKEPAEHKAAAKDTITVRTSIKPDEDLEVTPAEHLDLEAQDLLVKSELKGARLRGQEREGK